MRNTIMIFISAILGAITIAIVMTILGRMNRSVELQSNLSTIAEKAVEHWPEERSPKTDEEMTALCGERLAVMSDTDGGKVLKVMKADMDKGVLAIQVMERFKHPSGKNGKTQWERIVIRNKEAEQARENCEVRFYMSKEEMAEEAKCYKVYTVQKGEQILAPAIPGMENVKFACWKDINDYMADFSQPVEQNLVYYAQWE